MSGTTTISDSIDVSENLVRTPVITEEGEHAAEALSDFIATLKRHPHAIVAQQESMRLDPYFSAFSTYLSGLADERANMKPQNRKIIDTAGTTSGLKDIFNKMAAVTRNALISEVAVLRDDIDAAGPAMFDIFSKRRQFMVPFNYMGASTFRFGFHQITHDTGSRTKISTTAFPVFMVSASRIDELPPGMAQPLMEDLQSVLTLINHDPLHHMTLPIINGRVAEKIADTTEHIEKWNDYIPYGLYEQWAHLGYERIVLNGQDTTLADTITGITSSYFDKLDACATEMTAQGVSPEDVSKTVDYFSTLMCHTLSRLFPLTHPVMTAALARAEAADPMAASLGMKLLTTLDMRHQYSRLPPEELDKKLRAVLQNLLDYEITDVFKAYRTAGYDLTEKLDYASIKQVQLCILSPVDTMSHLPAQSFGSTYMQNNTLVISDLHRKQDRLMLEMVVAAAKTVDFKA